MIQLPRTIPPFHFTNMTKMAKTEAYGANAGRMSGSTLGNVSKDCNRSTESHAQHCQN